MSDASAVFNSGPIPANVEDRINDTTAHTGQWTFILALQDCTFTSLISQSTRVNGAAVPAGGSELAGMQLLKGMLIRGSFTKIQLLATTTPGDLYCYNPPT